jgi:hypothetical protein
MASIIEDSTLTLTFNEDIKLNGQQFGGKTVHTITGINEACKRIFNVPLFETQILALSSSAGAGTYDSSKIKYARLTNLDDTNFVRLSFSSGSLNKYDVKLPANRTICFCSPSMSGSSTGDLFSSFVDFDSLKAKSDTAVVDVELFVATS